jgi:hypothetical protein
MKKLIIGGFALLALMTVVGSAGATKPDPLPDCFPGCRINVFRGTPTSYPAGQEFVIFHAVNNGGVIPPEAIGKDVFTLDVDGVPRAPDAIIHDATPPPELVDFSLPYPILFRGFVFDFPNGMTGTHTFTGHWFESCANAVADGSRPDLAPCAIPAQQVEFLTRSLTVTFTS